MAALLKATYVTSTSAVEIQARRVKIAPADYHSVVSDEEIKAEKQKLSKDFNFDDWEVVDGPAW